MQNGNTIQTVIYEKDFIDVLDQLLLPHEVKYIRVSNTKDAWKVIREMNVRGAPLIAVVAVQGIRVELLGLKEIHNDINKLKTFLKEKTDYLKTSRPTAVNLFNDLEALVESTKLIESPDQLIQSIINFAQKNLSDYEQSSYDIARHGADTILAKLSSKSEINVLTICNTGKLAMPGLGTALGIVRELFYRKKLKTVYIPETRPYNQGSRLTSFEAMSDNLPGVLITDSMIGMLMQKKLVDCVVVGADRVTKFGYTANKIGTYSIAVLAKQHNIPFYVACPDSTIDYNMIYGREITIEERPGDELRKVNGTYIAPKEIPVWNPSFDITPPSLIEGIITEKGLFEFDRNSSAWEEFHFEKQEKLFKFLKRNKLIEGDAKIKYIGDGNLNYVYCVRGEKQVICVKQALPWCKCIGTSFPLSLKRTFLETEALKFYNQVCPDLAPKLYYYNEDLSLFIMEFLDNHDILRTGLMKGTIYKGLGKSIGEFVAQTTFHSGVHHLSPEKLREQISFWNENTLCKLTEQVVFSDPYIIAELNRWTSPQLDQKVNEIKSDVDLIFKVYELRQKFILNKQALIHADLHSGSIMVNNESSFKVIDAEFGFYGPIGYDIGNVIAHLMISYLSHKSLNNVEEEFYNWILEEIISFWRSFETQYRRIVGVAHVQDFETIQDQNTRGKSELLSLYLARYLIVETEKIKSVENLVDLLKKLI